eukprot:gene5974-7426_t
MIGASLLWVGWFGFNAGSALEAGDIAALAFINTLLATACATVSWVFGEWIAKGKPSMLGAASGAVAGLVAITPAAGFVGPMGALVIGLLAGIQDLGDAPARHQPKTHAAPEALADAPWLQARVSSMRVLTEPDDTLQYLRIAYPYLHLELIAAAAVRGDQDELVRLILAFASYRRQKNDARGQCPLVAELADLPAAAAYGPFRFDPATVLERQEEALRLGPLDWLQEQIQSFEALLLENALLSEQPACGLPLIDARLEALLT